MAALAGLKEGAYTLCIICKCAVNSCVHEAYPVLYSDGKPGGDTGEDDGQSVIGTDDTGNFVGIDREREVLMFDYGFRETSALAGLFEGYILLSLCME